MKKIYLVLLLFTSVAAKAQWSNAADNQTTGNLSIGSTVENSYSKFVIKGPNSPMNSASKRDVSFEFAAAGKAMIRSYRGASWDTYLQFLTSSPTNTGGTPVPRLHIDANGYVGIGTTTPLHNFEVTDVGGTPSLAIKGLMNSKIFFEPVDGSPRFSIWANMDVITNKDLLRFNSTSNADILVLKGDGNIGIGTTNPGSFKLAVEGKIGAREINVTANTPWPDYVFETTYKLPTLEELNAYIKINKHLPEIPSSCTMEENGVNLGEMNMLLLKKVEELTLYMIEMKKENEKQQNQIEMQQKMISQLAQTLIK